MKLSNPFRDQLKASETSSPATRMVVRDLYHRVIQEGDEVILHQTKLQAPRVKVMKITPNLAPHAKPNTLQVVLHAQVMLVVQADTPVAEIIRTLEAEEIDAANRDQAVPPVEEPQ